MECKDTCKWDYFRPWEIKVEPYWNVKEVAFVHALDTEAIKVEPYWNYIDSYVKIVL